MQSSVGGTMSDKPALQKKGLLFTVMTFLLMFSVFIIALSYAERISSIKGMMVGAGAIHKQRYYEDDIASRAYADLLGLNISLTHTGNTRIVNLSIPNIGNGTNPHYHMQFYKDFIERVYSSDNNINITLREFNATITLSPINTTISLDTNNTKLTNLSLLSEFSLVLKTNETAIPIVTPSFDAGAISLNIAILNESDEVISTTVASVSGSGANSITYAFGGAKIVIFEFGQTSIGTSSMVISTTIPVEYRGFSLSFLSPSPLSAIGGNVSIASRSTNSTKNTKILLAKES
ncbi:MAG: hypothetical protein QS99_C0017G0008 [archaeon GW2011_AR4]|nr:MAG: hypothetical protein QS99_C0017G0008 [archaeon GW2011_AR4]